MQMEMKMWKEKREELQKKKRRNVGGEMKGILDGGKEGNCKVEETFSLYKQRTCKNCEDGKEIN